MGRFYSSVAYKHLFPTHLCHCGLLVFVCLFVCFLLFSFSLGFLEGFGGRKEGRKCFI